MKKNELILIIVTAILLIVIAIGFYRDQNEKVIDRTIGLEITDNMEIVEMEKRGMLLFRSSYAAKIKIDYEKDPDVFVNALIETYGTQGEIIFYDEFENFKTDVLGKEKIVPNPIKGTNIFVLGVEDSNQQDVVYIIDTEGEEEAYLYIYFSR